MKNTGNVRRAMSVHIMQRETINTSNHGSEKHSGNFTDHGQHAKNKSIVTLVTKAVMPTFVSKVVTDSPTSSDQASVILVRF